MVVIIVLGRPDTLRIEYLFLIMTEKSLRVLFDLVDNYFTCNLNYFYINIIIGFSSFKWYISDLLPETLNWDNQPLIINGPR